MYAFNAFSNLCPSRTVVDDVIDRWPALVLISLLDNPRRFAETARTVGGISDRMLSRTLSTLTADGLIQREDRGDQHVEYRLTEAGHRVAIALNDLLSTIYEVTPDVLQARKAG